VIQEIRESLNGVDDGFPGVEPPRRQAVVLVLEPRLLEVETEGQPDIAGVTESSGSSTANGRSSQAPERSIVGKEGSDGP